jgi:hypothetical protein
MNKHQIAFLKSLGFTKAMIDALIATKEEDAAPDLAAHLAAFRETQLKLYENDPDLVTKIETAATGKIKSIIERKIKSTFNLSSDITKDKSVEELITIAKAETAKGTEKPIQELQTEIATLNGKIKEYEETILPGERTKVDSEIKAFKKDNLISTLLAGKKLRVPLKTAKAALLAELGDNYDAELADDSKDIKLFGKGSKLQAKSKDGTSLLTFDSFMTSVLADNKLLEESYIDAPDTGKKTPVHVLSEEEKIARQKELKTKPHLSAADAHLQKLREQNAANKLADEASQKKMAGE